MKYATKLKCNLTQDSTKSIEINESTTARKLN